MVFRSSKILNLGLQMQSGIFKVQSGRNCLYKFLFVTLYHWSISLIFLQFLSAVVSLIHFGFLFCLFLYWYMIKACKMFVSDSWWVFLLLMSCAVSVLVGLQGSLLSVCTVIWLVQSQFVFVELIFVVVVPLMLLWLNYSQFPCNLVSDKL